MKELRLAAAGLVSFAGAVCFSTAATAAPPTAGGASVTESKQVDAEKALALELYEFAFPLVLMDLTMQQATNVPNASTVPMRAPVNQFAHFRSYPPGDAKDVVRFNFDTLYSFAWLDLSKEPVILTVPDTNGRFYLVPTLDMWTDVFSSLGSRTTGTKAGHFAYVAPGWRGMLPAGVQKIVAPTPVVWMMGRTQTNGPSDYENVHKVQDGLKLTPLSGWGKAYKPPTSSRVSDKVDNKTPPLDTTLKLSGVEMMARLAELMKKHPPHANDYPIVFRMKQIGMEPGKSWDPSKLSQQAIAAINEAPRTFMDAMNRIRTKSQFENGWYIALDNTGTYGTSYRQRALVALSGLGANLPADAIYPTLRLDSEGKPLDGANKYVLHFEKEALPPANAFWSLTMYDDAGFQVPNRLNRFAIGDRDKLKFNADGSLDLYLQAESPGADKEANWLPAPKSGIIAPTLRLYSPRQSALDGTWLPPAVKRAQ